MRHSDDARPMTTAEVMEHYHLSRTTLWELRSSGVLGFIQIGRKVLYLPEHLNDLLRLHERMLDGANSESQGGQK